MKKITNMKRTILLTAICFFTSMNFAQAQQVIYNGEDINPGWWPSPDFLTIDNNIDWGPKSGINTSDHCASMWINPGDEDWFCAGLGGLNIDVSAYNRISIQFYNAVISSPVRLELQDGIHDSQFVLAEYTTPGEWQELTFDIPAEMGNITTLLIAPHFVAGGADARPYLTDEACRFFWDNVTAFKEAGASVEKVVAGNAEIVSTQVYSVFGTFIGNQIDTKTLPQGIYILKQMDSKGNTITRKIYNY